MADDGVSVEQIVAQANVEPFDAEELEGAAIVDAFVIFRYQHPPRVGERPHRVRELEVDARRALHRRRHHGRRSPPGLRARALDRGRRMTIRVEINAAGVKALLTGPEIQADLSARAARIAAAAGDGMEADSYVGANRARATVRTATFEAQLAEAQDRSLTTAIDAGR